MKSRRNAIRAVLTEELATARERLPPLPPVRPLSDGDRAILQECLGQHTRLVDQLQADRLRLSRTVH